MKKTNPRIFTKKTALKPDRFADIADNELLEKYYQEHNNQWLGVLLQRYTLMLLGVCMKYLKNEDEARDGVQQVFLKVLGELPKYRVAYFKSWVYMIAKNYCLMKLRDKGKYTVEINERHIATPYENTDATIHIEKDITLEQMSLALQQLNKEQQQCVTLFYLEKKSYQEVVEQTGYSLLQVKSYIQNGKRNLKNRLDSIRQNEQ